MTSAWRSAPALTLLSLLLAAPLAAAPLLLVLNKEESTLAFVDPATKQVLARIGTGFGPHEIAASPDGRWAFVANYGTGPKPGSSISMIDVAQKKEVRRVDLGALSRPHGIDFAGGKVYFTAEGSRVFARYDPFADKIDWLVGTGQEGTHMILANADGSRLVTANIGSGTISLFEKTAAPGGWKSTVIPVGKGPEALDISPDGRELWTAHSQDGGVSIIDLASRQVTATFDAKTKRSNRLKFTPDGKRILISDLAGGELVVFDTATRKEVKRMKMGKSPEGILIPRGGSTAYVAVAGDNQIAVLDLNSLEVTGKISPGEGPDGMAWVEGQ